MIAEATLALEALRFMEVDMSDIKPSIMSALTILLIVLITVPVAKYALNRWPVPGLTDLVNAV